MKSSGRDSRQHISPQFWPILLNPQKVQVFFRAAQKNLYHLKAVLVGYKYRMITLHRLLRLHPEKNTFLSEGWKFGYLPGQHF